MRVLASALIAVMLGGCSVLGVRPPQLRDSRTELDCDIVLPIADTLAGVALLGREAVLPGGQLDSSAAIPLASAIYGFAMYRRCRRLEHLREDWANAEMAGRAHRQAVRDEAWTLTKQAAVVARAGDCPTALAIGTRVRALDLDFHASVFMVDIALARCATSEPAR
ncbi:MAG: hypothetical protein H0T89_21360 [Deltaproteobacteria bacterium]|nr:hypothetical protein [Deltaproteobacteria bacterium]MDQ3297185.1 hypothetical protein [Myxococcota bacterium]